MSQLFHSIIGRAALRALVAVACLAGGLALSANAATPPVPQQTPRPEKKKLKAGANFEQYAGRDASNRLIAGGATRGFGDPCSVKKPTELNDCGMKHYAEGRYDDAAKAFSELVKLAPTSVRAHFSLGASYEAAGKHKEAVEAYRALIALNPDKLNEAFARYNLANVLATQGQFAEAVEENKKVVQIASDEPVAHFNLGMSYLRADKYEEAQAGFKETVRLIHDKIAKLDQAKGEKLSAEDTNVHAKAVFYLGLTKLLLTDAAPETLDEYKTLQTLKPELAEQLKKAVASVESSSK